MMLLLRSAAWLLVCCTSLLICVAAAAVMLAGAYKLLKRTRQQCEQGAWDRLRWRGDIDGTGHNIALWPPLKQRWVVVQAELDEHAAAVERSRVEHRSAYWVAVGVVATTSFTATLASVNGPLWLGPAAVIGGAAVVGMMQEHGQGLATAEKSECATLDAHLQTVKLQATPQPVTPSGNSTSSQGTGAHSSGGGR